MGPNLRTTARRRVPDTSVSEWKEDAERAPTVAPPRRSAWRQRPGDPRLDGGEPIRAAARARTQTTLSQPKPMLTISRSMPASASVWNAAAASSGQPSQPT